MSALLLKTKLFIPSLVTDLVPRPNLLAQMDVGLDKRLSLVAAPAGFGKTTFISSWVRSIEHPVAWISLDEADNDPTVFWAYIVAGFQHAISDERSQFGQITTDQLPPTKTILTQLINNLAETKGKVILVLDDYHVISNPQIHEDITFLIKNQPSALHVVLLTRADPPLPIAKLRGRGLLTEIRANDLRFTVEETRVFLNETLGLDLSSADIAALDRRTEGWIIGLHLAALSMQDRDDKGEFISAFSGGHHFVLEYLTEEVIDRLPKILRNFLTQTAVLERFNAPLCAKVTGIDESETQLAHLQRQNLFIVPLDDEYIWFRYHHLFRDLLKNRLQKTYSTGQINLLFHRASQWHRNENELEEAVRYALQAQDYEQAADWIEQIIDQVIARGQVKTLMQWIGTLPQTIIRARPRLLMHQGWVVFLTGDVNSSSKILNQAKVALASVREGDERDFLHGRLSAMLATTIALSRNLPTAIQEAQESLALLPEDEFVFRARAMRAKGVSHAFLGVLDQALTDLETAEALALQGENKFLAAEICSQIGTVRIHQGALSQAGDAYRQILDFYEQPHIAPPACLGYIGLAEVALEGNDLENVEAHLKSGIELCQKGNIGYALQPAYLIGGLLKLIQGDVQSAKDTIRKGEDLSRRGGGSLESILGLARFQTRFHLMLGELEAAEAWAAGKLLPPGWNFDDLPLVLDEIHQSLLAQVSLRCGRFEKVLDVCNGILPAARNGGRLGRVLELSLFKALALWQTGKSDGAYESLKECLTLAEPEGYLRIFLEMGDSIVGLLSNAITKKIYPDFAARILTAHSRVDGVSVAQEQGSLVEALTAREMEVLRLMCKGYSNQKIADILIVSINTVKKHTSNIYGKLGVRNRAQAVLKAQEHGLI
jgi:LuxR family maltose regulon positive regulatory protein